MFEDTRPAELDAAGDADAWADFRVRSEAERLRVLRELRDGNVPVMLSSPGGDMLMTTLWALDTPQRRMTFSADAGSALLARLVAFDEAVAVAYCDSVKLQFDLHDLVLVRGAMASVLQSALPAEIYRFQRRSAYRVRPPQRQAPVARLRHPSIPEMALALRILDVSVGGCALWLPADVPPAELNEKSRLLPDAGGAPARVGQGLLVGLDRVLGFLLQGLGPGEVAFDLLRAVMQDLLHPRQRHPAHQQVEQAEEDDQPEELRREGGDIKRREDRGAVVDSAFGRVAGLRIPVSGCGNFACGFGLGCCRLRHCYASNGEAVPPAGGPAPT